RPACASASLQPRPRRPSSYAWASSRQPSVLPCLCLAFNTHGQDPRDLAFRELQPRAVLERSRCRLEAKVKQLLTSIVQCVLQFLVGHVPHISSSQRDPPPASRTSS